MIMKNNILSEINKGDIFYADLGQTIGAEQDGLRPVVIIQNDIGNKYSPTVIVLSITSKHKKKIPTHLIIPKEISNLPKDSIILGEQIRTIDKQRLKNKITQLPKKYIQNIDEILKISLNINKKGDEKIFYEKSY